MTSSGSPNVATNTTIPISGDDVISRSLFNLSAFLSRCRPWQEFVAAGVFDMPEPLTSAGDRLRKNGNYFRLNYGILLLACSALSLLAKPIDLLFVLAVFALWLIFSVFREDPLIMWGYHVSDRMVLLALILLSFSAVWFTGVLHNLIVGLCIGLLLSAIHGVFRNSDGLFMDEGEAASTGLIGSSSSRVDVMR
ncbi:PRA1 family protein G2 [Telopea speciosissima]|uniref:PRA1 family protein G2 n=1 Tax=Telopea speciosissima TaxID=54955 RepID=UPI001CC7E979|nr:PRA1 family protein G2 [Telopea speciosissima]